MVRMICIMIGYVCGLFQTAYIYGRLNGVDIRDHGSGNAGTTNALRTLGRKAGAITFLGDCLKCMVAIFIVNLLFGKTYKDMIKLLTLYTAAGTILGHNFPFYLNFRGGKGIAATAGLVLSFNPIMAVLGIITFFSTFFITHFVSLGSLLVYVGFMIELVVLGQLGFFHMTQPLLNELYVVGLFLAILAFYKHRENIKRLMSGTENKTYLSKKSN
ncbi:MAG TPA: glycerol-3-phosphate 1-O-acyltransferase PlsY [Candidatus Merdenecus merdavium]|nr:glycerol-3-phosphate 1-O-acyltransferase PlsY [Candidatus Merdenecus merdavium]